MIIFLTKCEFENDPPSKDNNWGDGDDDGV